LYLFPLPSFDSGCGLFLEGIQLVQQEMAQKLHMTGGFFFMLYSSSHDKHFSPVLSTTASRSSMISKKISFYKGNRTVFVVFYLWFGDGLEFIF
jgi:hypothetical protein